MSSHEVSVSMDKSNQVRSTETRTYRKRKRSEHEQRTRARIVDAAEGLHATLGPARTTVSAIAERAGVTRATVYRHFPDDEALFMACSAQWLSRQRLPDPDTWTAHDEPLARLRQGLADIYRYYRSGAEMLALIHRDAQAVPPRVAAHRLAAEQRWRETLVQPFPDRRRKTIGAAVGHATAFSTWTSLCMSEGLTNRSAVDLMVGLVDCARAPEERAP
jgi:AcrR family transcriptional regulator